MPLLQDVHQQFASFFQSPGIRPFAYLLSKKLAEGHICLDLDKLPEELEILSANLSFPRSSYERLSQEKQVARMGDPRQTFILHRNKLYLQRYFQYESIILKRIST